MLAKEAENQNAKLKDALAQRRARKQKKQEEISKRKQAEILDDFQKNSGNKVNENIDES